MTTLKGIFPIPDPPRKKNYLIENVKQLRKMEKFKQLRKEEKELGKLQNQKQPTNKYQYVTPKVNSSVRGSSAISGETASSHSTGKRRVNSQTLNIKSSTSNLCKDIDSTRTAVSALKFHEDNSHRSSNKELQQSDKRNERHENNLKKSNSLSDGYLDFKGNEDCKTCPLYSSSRKNKYSHQSIQTLDTDDIDVLYSEGVIRYPSGKNERKKRYDRDDNEECDGKMALNGASSPDEDFHAPVEDQVTVRSAKIQSDMSSVRESKGFFKGSKDKDQGSISSKIAAHLNNGVVPPNYRKGVVPKYILERKEELQKKLESARLEAAKLAECPPGYILLPDNERKETLRMFKKSYEEYVNELNKMPIRSDTLRCQKKKIEIERQLNKLEEGIKLFSRPKVYVKLDE